MHIMEKNGEFELAVFEMKICSKRSQPCSLRVTVNCISQRVLSRVLDRSAWRNAMSTSLSVPLNHWKWSLNPRNCQLDEFQSPQTTNPSSRVWQSQLFGIFGPIECFQVALPQLLLWAKACSSLPSSVLEKVQLIPDMECSKTFFILPLPVDDNISA
jgi:hypothetical protein